jgi:hypothetical protein
LFKHGHQIILWTARGTILKYEKEEIKALTEDQLEEWGVKFHKLKFGKPYYDMVIDDRAVMLDGL